MMTRRGGTAAATIPRRLTFDDVVAWARRLLRESEWLRELSRIKRLRDLDAQLEAIRRFIRRYRRGTGTQVRVIPRHEARDYGLSAGNWGRWNEAQREIYLHEDVFTQSRLSAPTELEHEVGMAELHRFFGVSRDTVPVVTNPPGTELPDARHRFSAVANVAIDDDLETVNGIARMHERNSVTRYRGAAWH